MIYVCVGKIIKLSNDLKHSVVILLAIVAYKSSKKSQTEYFTHNIFIYVKQKQMRTSTEPILFGPGQIGLRFVYLRAAVALSKKPRVCVCARE